MAFFISPGVQVREFDISTIITQYANSAGAYVGSFEWGPVEDITVISSKARLQKYFGNPSDENALHWFSCSNFLDYANNLKVVRVVNEDIARNATVAGADAQKALDELKEVLNVDSLIEQQTTLIAQLPRLQNLKKQREQIKSVSQKSLQLLNDEKADLLAKQTAAETEYNSRVSARDAIADEISAIDTAIAAINSDLQNITATILANSTELNQITANDFLTDVDAAKANTTYTADATFPVESDYATDEAWNNAIAEWLCNKRKDELRALIEADNTAKTGYENQRTQKNEERAEKQDAFNTQATRVTEYMDSIYAPAQKAVAENAAQIIDTQSKIDDADVKIADLQLQIITNEDEQIKLQTKIVNAETAIREAEQNLSAVTCFIKNQSNWTELYGRGSNNRYGEFAAKYPSVLGSNLAVYMADANTYSGVSAVNINIDAYIYTIEDDGAVVGFTAPLTGPSNIAKGHIELDVDNPHYQTGFYKIKRVVIDVPGKDYRVAPDATLPEPMFMTENGFTRNDIPKAYPQLWKYANQFLNPPNTSNYVRNRGGENDELHIVVVDETGVMTGTKGQVMERFANVSKAVDARFDDNTSAYYVAVLRDQSQYVYWMDHPQGMTNWGLEARNTSFKMLENSYVGTFGGGVSGSDRENIGNKELIRGWDCFADPERVDIGILITGPADRNLQQYVINIAERRMDCVAVISPEMDTVVKNPGNELNAMLGWRDMLPASSYGFADCNWKYQYDQYNDTYRWLPCNPDIAGLMARTDEDHDPWWSPAGFNRGHIKNVVKLAWNPDKTDRDEMYGVSINPVCLFLNEGTILYGDKTMLLKTSAFSRINVRRLFIVLEKSISTAAKYMLFEFNDDFTRIRFKQMVEPFLRDVKGRRGMYDYRVVCDSSNNTPQVIDSNAFVGDIYIKPTRSINFIQLNFVAVATGVAFEEVVGSFGDF